MKKAAVVLFAFAFFLLLVALACFKPLDKTPYRQTNFYRHELLALDSAFQNEDKPDTGALETGWARVNLLPPFSTPIAIDAHRGGKHFEGVHDSIYVRAFVFRQGGRKVAYISADLLIIPPTVTNLFDTLLRHQGFDASNIFFTATHTHSSIGAWYDSYVGEKFAGKYDARVPQHIARCMTTAILQAEKNCSPCQVGYASFPTRQLVYNRLVKDMAHLPESAGEVDSLLRIVKLQNDKGEQAAIITFAAHNTVFHESLMSLSGDWSSLMMQQLDASGKINFSSFSAGAVGSQGPFPFSKEQETEARYMAGKVASLVLDHFDSISTAPVSTLRMIHLPLYLREPNLRASENIVLRPWLFHRLFGNEKVYINTLQIGNIVVGGMPCDFSGELVNELDSAAAARHFRLLITSFNGGYSGYITADKWYGLNTYETRLMNWFGPGNGAYLSEVLMRLLARSPDSFYQQ